MHNINIMVSLVEEMKKHNLCYSSLIISFSLEVFFGTENKQVRYFLPFGNKIRRKDSSRKTDVCHLGRSSVSCNGKHAWSLVLLQKKKKHSRVFFQVGLALMQL